MGQWRDRLLFVGKRNGSLAHPLQTVIVDVSGDGAVGPQHDTGLAAVFQDTESGFFHFFPEDYPAERWNIHIAGRLEDGDMSMSIHELEGEAWEAGKTYTLSLENRTELTLDALLTGGEGEEYARSIDLLERGEMLGSLVEMGKEDIQLTLFQQGKATGTYTGGWEVNGEYCYNSLLQMPFAAAEEPEKQPAGDAVTLESDDVALTAFQDSPLLLAEEGEEKRWLWSRGLETPYGILRLWLDEEEFLPWAAATNSRMPSASPIPARMPFRQQRNFAPGSKASI